MRVDVTSSPYVYVRIYLFPSVTRDRKFRYFPGIYARTTLLPKSPYRVILQATDESLLEGYGANSVSHYRFHCREQSSANYLKHISPHLQCVKGRWLSNLRLDSWEREITARVRVRAKFLHFPARFAGQSVDSTRSTFSRQHIEHTEAPSFILPHRILTSNL